MLFISRNTRLYQSVAHFSFIRRYMITCGIIIFLIAGWLYFIHYPAGLSYEYYSSEYIQLSKNCENITNILCEIKELSNYCNSIINAHNMYVQPHIDNYFKDEWAFIFETIHTSGLQLTTYTMLGVSEKEWYKKEKCHIEVCGDFVQYLHFFDVIKNRQTMITCHNVILSAVQDTNFRMSCDIKIVGVVH